MRCREIADLVGGTLVGPDVEVSVEASIDSREVVPGGLFCALPGDNVDGHRFVAAALTAGAAAALVSEPSACEGAGPLIVVDDVRAAMGRLASAWVARLRAAGELTVLAVTGSAGKTTTKDLLAHVLPGPTVATLRSLNNEIGLPMTALRATDETRYLVLEMGADHEGDLTYLTGLVPPDVAIVLMVGRAHLGVFGSQDAIARAKGELVQGLRDGGTAVLNADDPRVAAMAALHAGPVLTFGRGQAALRATDLELDAASCPSFTVTHGEESARVHLGLVGEHHVGNALAALAGALAAGSSLTDAAARLDGLTPSSPHRMDIRDRAGVTVIDDAYNANPDSMAAALRALARLAEGRRSIAVLGGMLELGESEAEAHAAVGELAASLGIDRVITVGEVARQIGAGVSVTSVEDPDEAGNVLNGVVEPGDVVLFKASNGIGLWRLAEEWRA